MRRKITLISLDNWGYNTYIERELKSYDGIEVNHINFDKLRYKYPTVLHRVLNFFLKTFFNYNLKRQHLNKVILQNVKALGYQDDILVIKSDFLSIKTVTALKSYTKRLIAYYNDNADRCPRIKTIHLYFDINYSFEKKDVEQFGFKFITNYIYHDLLDNKPDTSKKSSYDVFNISSLGKRNSTIEAISKALKQANIAFKIILVGKQNYIPKYGITFLKKKLTLKDVNKEIENCTTMLDVHRKGQNGLTFRVMDSLAYRKKLITTNQDIKNYDFYNPNNILFVNPENVEIPLSFFDKEYEAVPPDVYEKYTIRQWVKTVFEIN